MAEPEIRSHTAPPDPDGPDPHLDRGLSLDTTLDGTGFIRIIEIVSGPGGGASFLRRHLLGKG